MRLTTLVIVSCLVLLMISFAHVAVNAAPPNDAADTAPTASDDADTDAKAVEETKDPIAAWNELQSQRIELGKKLNVLRAEFEKADDDRKLEIRKEYTALMTTFQSELQPKMVKLAPRVYKLDPKQGDAGQIAMEIAFRENRYAESAKIADVLIAQGRNVDAILSAAGASQYAMHNFEQAAKIFNEAEKAGKLDKRGGQFKKAANDYIELWKNEQEIREREVQATGDQQLPRVELKTSRGNVVLELFENEAPNAVANFITLVESGKYDGIKFHRVLPNFMAQGGNLNTLDDDPANDNDGSGFTIECECYRDDARKHFRGTLSMAHAGKNTGGAQFFLTHLPTYWLNAGHSANPGHTVFGRVAEGQETVDAISVGDALKSAKVLRKRNHEYKPERKVDKPAEENSE